MTVGQLDDEMTDVELWSWMAFTEVEAREREHAEKVRKTRGRG